MHHSNHAPLARFARTLRALASLLAVALVLAACGFTDERDTNYNIYFESDLEESLAPIGAFMNGEEVRVTFQVKEAYKDAVDRTDRAAFELRDVEHDDDLLDFNFTESTDLGTQPFHTLVSYVYDARATLCATYDGPEVVSGPVEVCRRVMTLAEDDL